MCSTMKIIGAAYHHLIYHSLLQYVESDAGKSDVYAELPSTTNTENQVVSVQKLTYKCYKSL